MLALREALVAKLVILVNPPLILFILALRVVLVGTLVMSGILSSIYFYLIASFLMTSFFTISLNLLKSAKQVLIYQHLIYLLYFSSCLNYLDHFLVYQYLASLPWILN